MADSQHNIFPSYFASRRQKPVTVQQKIQYNEPQIFPGYKEKQTDGRKPCQSSIDKPPQDEHFEPQPTTSHRSTELPGSVDVGGKRQETLCVDDKRKRDSSNCSDNSTNNDMKTIGAVILSGIEDIANNVSKQHMNSAVQEGNVEEAIDMRANSDVEVGVGYVKSSDTQPGVDDNDTRGYEDMDVQSESKCCEEEETGPHEEEGVPQRDSESTCYDEENVPQQEDMQTEENPDYSQESIPDLRMQQASSTSNKNHPTAEHRTVSSPDCIQSTENKTESNELFDGYIQSKKSMKPTLTKSMIEISMEESPKRGILEIMREGKRKYCQTLMTDKTEELTNLSDSEDRIRSKRLLLAEEFSLPENWLPPDSFKVCESKICENDGQVTSKIIHDKLNNNGNKSNESKSGDKLVTIEKAQMPDVRKVSKHLSKTKELIQNRVKLELEKIRATKMSDLLEPSKETVACLEMVVKKKSPRVLPKKKRFPSQVSLDKKYFQK